MKYQYTLEDGAHFVFTARDVSDLLDILHGRTNLTGDSVKVWKAEEIDRQLNRALDHLEDAIKEELEDIRYRRDVREGAGQVEWEPAEN